MASFIKKIFKNEIMRYTIAGGVITVANAVCYYLLLYLGLIYTAANIISIIFSKVVGYLLNKFWVYKTKTIGWQETFFELCRFIMARGFTGIFDFFGLIFLIEIVGIDKKISKIIIILLVIFLNYILGKKTVFLKKN